MRVFISYARADDEDFVQRLCASLEAAGFGVWWDRRAMESRGRTFLQELRDAIEGSDRVLAVIGPAALASPYVRVEWEHARLFCKGVLPVLRRGAIDSVPGELSALHLIDFCEERPYAEALQELCDKLRTEVPPLGRLRGRVPSLPAHFLARADDLARIASAVLADVRRPTVVTAAEQVTCLEGMSGTGKSVLASAFARAAETRRAFGDGIVWLSMGQDIMLLAKLRLLATALDLDASSFIDEETACVGLSKRLADATCLIVLDDVWHVEHGALLRDVLGPRCRLLVTTQNVGLTVSLGANRCSVDVLAPSAARHLLAEWAGVPDDSLPAEAAGVANECGGLPLALAMIGAMVRAGTGEWRDALEALRNADLVNIARQFPNYPHANLLKALAVSVDALPAEVQSRYRDLAVFAKGVSVPERTLALLWFGDAASGSKTRRVIGQLVERSLGRRDANGRVFLHDLQSDFVRHQVSDLLALHGRLLDAYRTTLPGSEWWSIEDDGYVCDHLTLHLEHAGRLDDIHALLCASTDEQGHAWWTARARHGQPDGFLDDLARGRRLADGALVTAPDARRRASAVRLQTCYCLIDSSISALDLSVPPEVLPRLVTEGVIGLREALFYARRSSAGVIALAPLLEPSVRSAVVAEALARVRADSSARGRVSLLVALAGLHEGPERDALVREAIESGKGRAERTYPDPDEALRLHAVETVVASFPAGMGPPLLDLVDRIWWGEGFAKAAAFLAPHLDEQGRGRLLVRARRLHGHQDRALALTRILACQPVASLLESDVSMAVRAACDSLLETAADLLVMLVPLGAPAADAVANILEAWRDPRQRERYALGDLASAPEAPIARHWRDEVLAPFLGSIASVLEGDNLGAALAIAAQMASADARAWALAWLAPRVVGPERDVLLASAVSGVRNDLDDNEKCAVLPELVKHLRVDLADTAFEAAGEIADETLRADLLVRMWINGPDLRERHAVEPLVEATAVLMPESRIDLLIDLAQAETPSKAQDVWRAAIASLGGFQSEWSPPAPVGRLYREIPDTLVPLAAAAGFGHVDRRMRVEALRQLGPRLHSDLLREGLRAVRQIGDADGRAVALTTLFPGLPEASRQRELDPLMTSVRGIRTLRERLRTFATLAATLEMSAQTRIRQELLETLAASRGTDGVGAAIETLAPIWPAERLDSLWAVVRAVDDVEQKATAMVALVERAKVPTGALTAEALEVLKLVASDYACTRLLTRLAGSAPVECLGEVAAAAGRLRDADREYVLCAIVPRVAVEEKASWVQQALEAFASSEYPYHVETNSFVGWCCAFGEHLPDTFVGKIVREARSLNDPVERARALAQVASRYHVRIPDVAREAVGIVQALDDRALRATLLGQLAPVLPPDAVDLALLDSDEIAEPVERASALVSLARRLEGPRKTQALTRALESLSRAGDQRPAARHRVLLRLIPELPDDLLERALTTALSLADASERRSVLKELGTRHPRSLAESFVIAGDEMAEIAGACSTVLSEDERMVVWTRLLHRLGNDSRESAMVTISRATRLLGSLAGEDAVEAAYRSIQQITTWWP